MTEEGPRQSAAATAAEKVRAIVEAAERSASELEAAAREDATRIRAEAERESESLVTRARELSARLSARARELERRVAEIRESIDSLGKDLAELRADRAPSAGATAAPAEPAAAIESQPVASMPTGDEPDALDPTIVEAEATAARGPVIGEPEGSGEGARVIALNMALRGATRDETARYLAENFELDDPDALLDDVYARAGS